MGFLETKLLQALIEFVMPGLGRLPQTIECLLKAADHSFRARNKEALGLLNKNLLHEITIEERTFNVKVIDSQPRWLHRTASVRNVSISATGAKVSVKSMDGALKVLLLLYVDNVYLVENDPIKLAWYRTQLFSRFAMTDLDPLSYSLGIEFLQRPTGLILMQRGHILQILSDFQMLECNPVSIPLLPGLQLRQDMGALLADLLDYQRLEDKLLFCNWTRSDITFAVAMLCRFTAALQLPHMEAAKHLLHYLKSTLSLGLQYSRGEGISLSKTVMPSGLKTWRIASQQADIYFN